MPALTITPPPGPAGPDLKEGYEALWTTFANEMRAWTRRVEDWAAGTEALHPFLESVQWTPKAKLREAVRVGDDTPNVGSATGLFFEHVAAVAIEARIRSQVEGSASHRNRLGTHVAGAGARKQPDLILVNEATGRAVVFEFKTSPKSNNIDGVRGQKASWETDPNVRFFLVAGYADGTVAASLVGDEWAAVLRKKGDGSAAHTVDHLVASAVRHLTAATP